MISFIIPCYNEEKHIKACIRSIRKYMWYIPYEIIVVDTGSTDRTVEILEANGAKVAHIYINPWRFDDARNAALALIPRDYDVCVSLDLDEELQPGWREEIERVWIKGETTRLRYMFDWGAGINFYYEKIHARH